MIWVCVQQQACRSKSPVASTARRPSLAGFAGRMKGFETGGSLSDSQPEAFLLLPPPTQLAPLLPLGPGAWGLCGVIRSAAGGARQQSIIVWTTRVQ